MIVDVLEYFMGQSELMTPAEFVKMYEKPPQVTLDGGQSIRLNLSLIVLMVSGVDILYTVWYFVVIFIAV